MWHTHQALRSAGLPWRIWWLHCGARSHAMRLWCCLLVLLLIVVAGCGGGRRQTTPAQPQEEAPPEAVSQAESAVPGLTQAEVDLQPPAPALPRSVTHRSAPESLVPLAESEARREAGRRGFLPEGLDAGKRALWLAHVWRGELVTLQRAQASHIEGLTVGELQDQPATLPLPEVYGLQHGPDDLRIPALLAAQEEVASGSAGGLSVEARALFLEWTWRAELAERQAVLQRALAERDLILVAGVADARRRAEWERRNREMQQAYDLRAIETGRAHLPVLSDAERAELERLGRR